MLNRTDSLTHRDCGNHDMVTIAELCLNRIESYTTGLSGYKYSTVAVDCNSGVWAFLLHAFCSNILCPISGIQPFFASLQRDLEQIFYFVKPESATKQCLPFLQLKSRGLSLPACCWKRSLQHSKCRGIAHRSSLPTANKYLFAEFLFFTSGEGDETMAPSFTTRYAAIEASSALLEALIASLLPTCGAMKEATFPTAINLVIAIGSLFSCADGKRATSPSCTLIGAYNTSL